MTYMIVPSDIVDKDAYIQALHEELEKKESLLQTAINVVENLITAYHRVTHGYRVTWDPNNCQEYTCIEHQKLLSKLKEVK